MVLPFLELVEFSGRVGPCANMFSGCRRDRCCARMALFSTISSLVQHDILKLRGSYCRVVIGVRGAWCPVELMRRGDHSVSELTH